MVPCLRQIFTLESRALTVNDQKKPLSSSSKALGLPTIITILYSWIKVFRRFEFRMRLQALFLFLTRKELAWITFFLAFKQTGLIALSPLHICFLPKQERFPKRMGVGREWWGGKQNGITYIQCSQPIWQKGTRWNMTKFLFAQRKAKSGKKWVKSSFLGISLKNVLISQRQEKNQFSSQAVIYSPL